MAATDEPVANVWVVVADSEPGEVVFDGLTLRRVPFDEVPVGRHYRDQDGSWWQKVPPGHLCGGPSEPPHAIGRRLA